MKRFLFSMALVVFTLSLCAQQTRKDTTAIMILDKMCAMIRDMQSCSFTLNTAVDVIDVELGLVKYFSVNHVYMAGPNKMLIATNGYKGELGFWYNGETLLYYSYSENNYAVIDAPETTLATIDSVHHTFGIDFPAADFFYPTFTNDLIATNDDIILGEKAMVNGKPCFHIIAKNKDMGVQIWVSADALFLPQKFVISDYHETPTMQYEATFSDWIINPVFPDALFDFTPPLDANQVTLIAK